MCYESIIIAKSMLQDGYSETVNEELRSIINMLYPLAFTEWPLMR